MKVKLAEQADSLNFRTGERVVYDFGGYEPKGHNVVQSVDTERGVVVLREPTRSEAFRWWLSTPWRWIRRRWNRWRYAP